MFEVRIDVVCEESFVPTYAHEGRTCSMEECAIDNGSRSWGMRCSACGEEFEHKKPEWHSWRFCPNCGAEVVDDAR